MAGGSTRTAFWGCVTKFWFVKKKPRTLSQMLRVIIIWREAAGPALLLLLLFNSRIIRGNLRYRLKKMHLWKWRTRRRQLHVHVDRETINKEQLAMCNAAATHARTHSHTHSHSWAVVTSYGRQGADWIDKWLQTCSVLWLLRWE